MNLFAWLRRTARPAPARSTFRPRLERLEDRCVPTAVGFSTALPGAAYGMAVDAAGDTYVTTVTIRQRGLQIRPVGPASGQQPVGGRGRGRDRGGRGRRRVPEQPRGDHRARPDPAEDPVLRHPSRGPAFHLGGSPGTGTYGTVTVAGGKIYAVGTAGAGLPTTSNAYQTTFPGAATGTAGGLRGGDRPVLDGTVSPVLL